MEVSSGPACICDPGRLMHPALRLPYDYDRRTRKVANAAEQLPALQRIVALARRQISEVVAKQPDDRYTPLRVALILKSTFEVMLRVGAGLVFLEVLREYEMPTSDRKVIERAAKTFSKTRIVVKREKAPEVWSDLLYEYETAIETAFSVLQKNERHKDEGSSTTLKAGSFQLINTGGFSDAVMKECAKVVAMSEKRLREKGLGKVCYGDVHVTNTVHRSTRTLAFYLINDDSLYVRANLKGKIGPAVMSVEHELGHRLQFKFLQSKKREINAIYTAIKNKRGDVLGGLISDKSRWPQAGDTYLYKGETFLFDKVDLSQRAELKVLFRHPEMSSKLSMPLIGYLFEKYPEMKDEALVFVSNYAATDPDENFAEMIAFLCEDRLPADQEQMLKEVIG